jgi:hypothetical protein
MGLDITAYAGLKALDAVYNRNGEPIDIITRQPVECVELYVNNSFPNRELPFTDAPYSYTGKMSCFYMSYSGYGRWREELAKIAGYPAIPDGVGEFSARSHSEGCWAATEGPFFELINFSDCEGVLGTTVLKKLLIDFETHEEAAKNVDQEWFYQKYKALMEEVRFAATDGALVFH